MYEHQVAYTEFSENLSEYTCFLYLVISGLQIWTYITWAAGSMTVNMVFVCVEKAGLLTFCIEYLSISVQRHVGHYQAPRG